MSLFFKTAQIELHQGNCLEIMPTLSAQSFDAIIADLPYGTTACSWDVVIPFEPLWEQYKRLIKPNGAIVLFGSQPFTSELVMSNRKWFKYCWVWDKVKPSGHLNAQIMPMKRCEDICVFGQGKIAYYPLTTFGKAKKYKNYADSDNFGKQKSEYRHSNTYYPSSLIAASVAKEETVHPTQKPVHLLSYLIKTYTNVGDRILDNTAGSFTTGVAAVLTGRQFTGIELSSEYCAIGQKRIEEAIQEIDSMLIKPWDLEQTPVALQGNQIDLFGGEIA